VPASFACAQIGTGDIYGRVVDASGGILPGAAVTLSGPFSRSTVSDGTGDFRFLHLDAETYHVTVTLPGFASVEQTVRVTTGERLHLDFRLEIATVEASLTVPSRPACASTISRRGTNRIGADVLTRSRSGVRHGRRPDPHEPPRLSPWLRRLRADSAEAPLERVDAARRVLVDGLARVQ
jgi:Carboxypeptidase regulatory-like domain